MKITEKTGNCLFEKICEEKKNEMLDFLKKRKYDKTEDEPDSFYDEEYAEEYDNPYDKYEAADNDSGSLWLAHDRLDTDETFDMEWYELSHEREGVLDSLKHLAGGFTAVFIIAVIVIAWLAGMVYYSAHFVNKSAVNGLDVSGMTAEEAQEAVLLQEPVYVFTVVFPDSEFIVSDNDVDIELKTSPTIREILGTQNVFLWPFEEFIENRYSVTYIPSYNEETMRAWLTSELHRMNEKLTAEGFERVDVTDAREQILKAMPTGDRILDLSGDDNEPEEDSDENES